MCVIITDHGFVCSTQKFVYFLFLLSLHAVPSCYVASVCAFLTDNVCVQEFKKFWPEKDSPAEDFGHFHVSFQSSAEDGLYTSTDFLLQSTQVSLLTYISCILMA